MGSAKRDPSNVTTLGWVKTGAYFDPQATVIIRDASVPSPQRSRKRPFLELMGRMSATESVVLSNKHANSLVSQMKRSGVNYAKRVDFPTRGQTQVWREPSAEQLDQT